MASRHLSMTAGASTSIDLSAPSYFKLHLNPDDTRNAGLYPLPLSSLSGIATALYHVRRHFSEGL